MTTKSPWIAFFFATPTESRGLKKRLVLRSRVLLPRGRVFCGHHRRHPEIPLLIVETGMGPEAARQTARYVFGHFSLSQAWVLGLAGGTRAGLSSGQAILATQIGSWETSPEQGFVSSSSLRQRAKEILEREKIPFQEGPLLTVNHVVNTPEEKARWGQEYASLALEMEGFPIALTAQEKGVPWGLIRWIFDPMELTLPPLEALVDEQGRVKPGKTLAAFVKSPSLILQMPALFGRARRALRKMNHFLQKWFESGSMAPS